MAPEITVAHVYAGSLAFKRLYSDYPIIFADYVCLEMERAVFH